MNCRACGRALLSGSVRCIYCGEAVPAEPDFDLGAPPPEPAEPESEPQPASAAAAVRPGLIGLLIFLLLKWKSVLALLKVGPLMVTGGSMLFWVFFYARRMGWQLALGFAVTILIHELGHVVVARRYGLKSTAPIFIPMFGALILTKGFRGGPVVEADVGAGGPIGGMVAWLGCLILFWITGNDFFLMLSALTAAMNLFNLIPIWQLDGAHIGKALSPLHWNVLIGALLVPGLATKNMLLLIFAAALFFLKSMKSGEHDYLDAPLPDRARLTGIYLGLLFVLGWGAVWGFSHYLALNPPQAAPGAVETGATEEVGGESLLWMLIVLTGLIGWGIAIWVASLMDRGSRSGSRAPAAAAGLAAMLMMLIRNLLDLGPPPPPALLIMLGAAGTAAGSLMLLSWLDRRLQGDAGVISWRRALGTAALVAAAAGLWLEDPVSLAVLALLTAAYFARRRDQMLELVSSVASRAGMGRASRRLLERAAEVTSSEEEKRRIILRLVSETLSLNQPRAALCRLESLRAEDRDLRDARWLEAEARLQLGEPEPAIRLAERLLASGREADRLPRARLLLARAALVKGWPDEAEAQAILLPAGTEKFSAEEKGWLGARSFLVRADAALLRGSTDQALRLADRASALDPSREILGAAELLRSKAAELRGDAEASLRSADRARVQLPENPAVRLRQAQAMMNAGRREDALRLLNETASGFGGEPAAEIAASLLGRMGEGQTLRPLQSA